MQLSRSHEAVIRVYDDASNVIETYEHRRRFQRVMNKRVIKKGVAIPTITA